MLPDKDHRLILEALEAGDGMSAATTLRRHLREALEFCLERLPQ
jgi:DNA-binding GntR family transcriptional regulator